MKSLRRFVSALLTVVLALPLSLASAEGFQSNLDAIDRAAKSVLMLEVYDQSDKLTATGSGFVAFDGSTLVTNYHVMEDASLILGVSDAGDQYRITRVIAADKSKDIALLQFDTPSGLTPLSLASGEGLRRAAPVVAIGSPKGVTNSVSTGIISALYEEDGVSLIQFTAPISHGSSGGALFNDDGQVIGITSAYYKDTQNMNLAVNISEITGLHESSANAVPVRFKDYVPGVPAAATPRPTAAISGDLNPVTEVRVAVTPIVVILSWDAIPSVKEYRVFRASAAEGYSLIGTVNVPVYYDRDAVRGETYSYMVQCANGSWVSDLSAPVSAALSGKPSRPTPGPTATSTPRPTPTPTPKPTPTPTPKPTPTPTPKPTAIPKPGIPSSVSASKQKGGIKVTWIKAAYAQTYYVYRSTGSSSSYSKVGESQTDSYFDGVTKPGVYFYKMRGVNASGQSDFSKTIAVVEYGFMQSSKQPVPKGLKVKTTATSATLTWTAVKDADQYVVYRSNKKDGTYAVMCSVATNKFVDKSVRSGTQYYYKVCSASGISISKQSSAVSASVPKPKPTPTPYVEPRHPLVIGDYGYTDTYKGNPKINPDVKNISGKKTVDGFTLIFYCEDVYHEKIKRNGNGVIYTEYTYSKTVKPGQTLKPGYVWLSGFSHVKYLYVAVKKIHTKDGTTIAIPESDWDFYYWTMK